MELIFIAIAATIVPFALWWLYFNEDENLNSDEVNHVFVWGYAHFLIFALKTKTSLFSQSASVPAESTRR